MLKRFKQTISAMALLIWTGYCPCFALPTVPSRTDFPIPDALAPAPECKVISSEFGTMDQSGNFTAATEVPLLPGQAYGWRIKVEPASGIVHWKEEFKLPAVPATWGGNKPGDSLAPPNQDLQEVQADGKVCVSERDSLVVDGIVSNFWTVAKGDPLGQYEMRVFVEGKLVQTFVFKLKEK
jgi:hypothetical protein